MKAVVLAGGKGSRLYPYSAVLPKPLMPLGDIPVLELLLRQLRKVGVEEVVLAVNHQRHLIEAFCGDGSRFDLKLRYSLEDEPLGTAGPIAAVVGELGDDFVITNGDLLTSCDIGAMLRFHLKSGAAATIGVYSREVKIDFGVIEVDEEMRMTNYKEKPTYQNLVSMGIYVLKAAAVRPFLNPGKYLDMPDLMKQLREAGSDVRCYLNEGFWLDIGRPEDFAKAQEIYATNPQLFLR
jgi:NDP-sugar pyrophosphorylase family protein